MRPSLVIVAGPNGSGKTTATEQLLGHRWLSGHEYINPDRIADARFGGWNDPHAVMEAARWATAERERLMTAGKTFAFETVFSSDEKLEFTRRAVEAGYFVRFFFIGTSSPDIKPRGASPTRLPSWLSFCRKDLTIECFQAIPRSTSVLPTAPPTGTLPK